MKIRSEIVAIARFGIRLRHFVYRTEQEAGSPATMTPAVADAAGHRVEFFRLPAPGKRGPPVICPTMALRRQP